MNTDKIKTAILVNANPWNNTTRIVLPDSGLTTEEYQLYCRASFLTTEERLERLVRFETEED